MNTSPLLIGGIFCYVNAKKEEGKKIEYILPESKEDAINYINNIFFPNGLDYEKYKNEELVERLKAYRENTFIPIIKFPALITEKNNNMLEKLFSEINLILKKQLKLKGDYLEAVQFIIAEFTQNIIDHSDSKFGILISRFYPQNNYIDLCIADSGKGFLKSYLDADKHHPKNDEESLNYAVFGKSTKDPSESRGFGISTSRKMLVQGLNGKLFMMSGNAFFNQNKDKQEIIKLTKKYYYKGCYIAIRIPILFGPQFKYYNFTE